jgi:dihydroorotate dehydrogenase
LQASDFGVFLLLFVAYLIHLYCGYHGKNISKVVDGIYYKTPFLLSAGFDYNGNLPKILPCIGLGGEEIGSVTAKRCDGNPKPRLTRLPKSKSIIVNKGLRNEGVDAIINRLKKVPKSDFVLGVSIAKTNCIEASSIDGAIEDYLYSFKRLNEEKVGDYYTLNISCPNAYGGEAFITAPRLDKLLKSISTVPCSKPVYVKMPSNIPWEQFSSLLTIIDKYNLNGVIIGNLNKNYDDLDDRNEAPKNYCGGLSGKPCEKLSTELISKTRNLYKNRFTIIGVGGVMSEQSANDKFDAGADLIMLITGIIYEGPSLIKRLCNNYYIKYHRDNKKPA